MIIQELVNKAGPLLLEEIVQAYKLLETIPDCQKQNGEIQDVESEQLLMLSISIFINSPLV